MTEKKTFNKVQTFILVEFEDGYEHNVFSVSSENFQFYCDRMIFEHGNIKHIYVSVEPKTEA